jgi:serine/threonine protein phosphatase 1
LEQAFAWTWSQGPLLSRVVDYPIVAIADLHGQRRALERLLAHLEELPEWPRCALVFLGDFVDRGPDVRGTIDLVLDLLDERPDRTAVMGNHDMALVRAARLDDGPPSFYWVDHYRENYDHEQTFESYLGRRARHREWEVDLLWLREAIPVEHRRFLAGLSWLVEATGHLFLHNGLSPELEQSAEEQVVALRQRRWDDTLRPRDGTRTAELWQTHYPVWLGADRRLSSRPLPCEGRVQVTGHVRVPHPEADAVRIRLDTSGGYEHNPLTACLLRSANAEPVFIVSR